MNAVLKIRNTKMKEAGLTGPAWQINIGRDIPSNGQLARQYKTHTHIVTPISLSPVSSTNYFV